LGEIFAVLNDVTHQIFSQFSSHGQPTRPRNECWYGSPCAKAFGCGTVHHWLGGSGGSGWLCGHGVGGGAAAVAGWDDRRSGG